MKKRELLKILEEGEGMQVEFKQRFSSHEKIAKEMIAFANSRGGYIVFGIDDDKSVYGVESEKEIAELVKETAVNFCEPPVKYDIDYIDLYGKEVVLIHIIESNFKPHRIQDYLKQIDLNNAAVFVRVNDKSVPASKEMIKLLQAETSKVSLRNYKIGKNEKIVFDYLDKNEKITVKELQNAANLSSRRASRTLIKLVRANILFIHTKDNGEDYFTYSGV